MADKNLLDVKIVINTGNVSKEQTVKIEKGCSFENNGAIYRVNDDCKLSVFNKSNQKWSAADHIEMKNYQFDTFRAVANNKFEKTDGQIKDIVLSKEDIDIARDQYKKQKLSDDLQQFLNDKSKDNYVATKNSSYSKLNGISTYVTNGKSSTSGTLVFKYGSADEAVTLSKYIKDGNKTVVPKKTKKSKTDKSAKVASAKSNVEAKPANEKKKSFFATCISNLFKKADNRYPSIKKEWLPYIKDISKRTGYSEDMIKLILSHEQFTKKATWKNEAGGLWEVGFGHTTKANHNNKFGKGFKIDLKTAFAWFEQDLKDKAKIVRSIGNKYYNYDKLPQSLKEAFIDTAYNRGEGVLDPKSKFYDKNYNKLRSDIKKKDYASAAVQLRQAEKKMKTCNRNGLRKRNVNRFMLATTSLPPQQQVRAMNLFNKNGYYDRTISTLRHGEAKILKQVWQNKLANAKQKQS